MKLDRVLRLIMPLLMVGLLISITLNLFLYTQGREYYLQLNETRLDPLGLSYYPSVSSPEALTTSRQTSVVFFGDSRAASWGIGAQTSAQTLYRFEAQVKPLQPQIVILQVGINDLKTIPLFPERKEAIIANCQTNIQQIVTQSASNGATVVLTTIFPIGQVPWERQPFWSPEVAQAIDEVNTFIRSLEEQNVIIFDADSVLVDNSMARDEYFQDTLHLNPTGYEALNVELARILASLK
jgi:lysophospholipase L1-like esterase